MILPFIAGLLGMGIVFLLVPLILKPCLRANWLNRSSDLHHTHQAPVPRLGGIALAAAFVGVQGFIALVSPEQRTRTPGWLVILFSSLAMFALGLWDDIKPLGAKKKLAGQILISVVVCCFGISIQTFEIPFTGKVIELSAWGVLLTVVWLVGMTNLINLIDGVDGLAGGICLLLMGLIAYIGHQIGSFELLASGMAGALLGFLWFNFPPARIYLGDGGAYFLGFQIGVFAIVNSHKGTVFAALLAPLFVLALPIVDMALAILRRGLRGLPIFRPDRRHIHHHLIGMGLSHRKVVLWFYAVTLVFLFLGLAAYWSRGDLVPGLLGIGVLVLLLCAGKLGFSREWFSVGRVVGNSLNMRQEVRYALCLTRWLELEGDRLASVEELWSHFVFISQKLGFTSVKLTLADGVRVWERPDSGDGAAGQVLRLPLRNGRQEILELKTHGGPAIPTPFAGAFPGKQPGVVSCCPSIADPNLLALVGDLLAEGWVKAAARCEKRSDLLPGTDAPVPVLNDEKRRESARPFAPVPLVEKG